MQSSLLANLFTAFHYCCYLVCSHEEFEEQPDSGAFLHSELATGETIIAPWKLDTNLYGLQHFS